LGAGHITIVVKRTGFRSAAFVAECHKPCTATTCLLPRSLYAKEIFVRSSTIFVVLILFSLNAMSEEISKVKEILYKNGLITFYIPSNWVEDLTEGDDVRVFYEDVPASGTLRVRVLSLISPEKKDKLEVNEVLEGVGSSNNDIIFLQNGNAYKHYVQKAIDSGQEITIYYWSLAQVVDPTHARLANFSYTILSTQNSSSMVQNELSFIKNQVESAQFYRELINGI